MEDRLVSPTGHYEYYVMPYGLVHAPSVFQDFMYEVLREFLYKFVFVYIDDILVYSRSIAQTSPLRGGGPETLGEYHLFLKAEKCSFHQTSVQFLGYNIDQNGIQWTRGRSPPLRTGPFPITT